MLLKIVKVNPNRYPQCKPFCALYDGNTRISRLAPNFYSMASCIKYVAYNASALAKSVNVKIFAFRMIPRKIECPDQLP